ncbi:unnamed protein product, partial [Linum tenue]
MGRDGGGNKYAGTTSPSAENYIARHGKEKNGAGGHGGTVEPSCYLSSSIYYGGQENYNSSSSPPAHGNPSAAARHNTTTDDPNGNNNNANSASRGNWWK